MTPPDFRRAYMAIEDDVIDLSAATGVLHLAFHDLSESGEGESALARSLYFTARSIEAICKRIEATLSGEAAPAEPPCTQHQEVRQ